VQVATLAGALVGVWVSGQPGADMVALTRAALDQLEPLRPNRPVGAPATGTR
jgi:hypothetical protein